MKKIFLLSLLMLFSVTIFAQEKATESRKFVDVVTDAQQAVGQSVETVYNDSKSVVETAYKDAKSTVEYITPKIEKAVQELADGLAVGATELFEILVLQQVVFAIVYTLILILSILFCTAFFKEIRKLKFNDSNSGVDIADKKSITLQSSILSTFYLVGASITAVIVLSNLVTIVMGFVNPEYGAIMEILNYAEKFIK